MMQAIPKSRSVDARQWSVALCTVLLLPVCAPTMAEGLELPAGAVSRLGSPFLRHEARITGAALSSDGALLASASEDGVVKVWNLHEHELVAVLGRRRTDVRLGYVGLGFDRSGLLLARTNEERSAVIVNEIRTGRETARLPELAEAYNLVFCRDDEAIAAVTSSGLKVVRLKDKAVTLLSKPEEGWGVLQPGCNVAATRDLERKRVNLYDLRSGQFLRSLTGVTGHLVAFSPAGEVVATSTWGSAVDMWSVATGRCVARFLVDGRETKGLSFSGRAGQLFALTSTLTLWDWNTGQLLKRYPYDPSGRFSFLTARAGRGCAYGGDHSLLCVEAATDDVAADSSTHHAGVSSIAITEDGHLLATGSADGTTRLWAIHDGGQIARRYDSASAVSSTALSPNGNSLAIGTQDGMVRLVDLAGREMSRILGGDDHVRSGVSALMFDQSGETLVSEYGAVDVWARRSGELKGEIGGEYHTLSSVCLIPSTGLLVTAEMHPGGMPPSRDLVPSVRVMNLSTGREVLRFGKQQLDGAECDSVAASEDGRMIASGLEDGRILIWELAVATPRLCLRTSGCAVLSLAFSPRNGALASVDKDGEIRVWDSLSGTEMLRIPPESALATCAIFDPTADVLWTGRSDTTIIAWKVPVPPPPVAAGGVPVDRTTLEHAFEALCDGNAEVAARAMASLVANGKAAVPILADRIRPGSCATPEEIRELAKTLSANEASARETASEKLESMHEEAVPVLNQVLTSVQDPEVRARIEHVLAAAKGPLVSSTEVLKVLRATEVLERVGSEEAEAVLSRLAEGPAGFRETMHARAALERIRKARASK